MSPLIERLFEEFGEAKSLSEDFGNNEIRREEIITELSALTHYAVNGKFVLIRTNAGRCLLESREVNGAPMMGFLYKVHNGTTSEAFWYNAESVKHIGTLLRNNAGKRVTMESLAQQ